MELKHYFNILRRWAWLLVLGLVLGGLAGYFFSRYQTPVYQAATRALVMRPPLEQSSDMTYYSDLQLVQTYIQLLSTGPVLEAASQRLGEPIRASQIKVQQNQETQIIEVTIEDNDPARAANIANIMVAVLIEQNQGIQSSRYASTEESIQAQIDQVENQVNTLQLQVDEISTQNFEQQLKQVETQIRPLQDEVSALQSEIAALQSPRSTPEQKAQVAEKQARVDQIKPLLDLYQQIYSNLVVLGKPVEADTARNTRLDKLQSTLDLYQNLYMNLLSSLETIRLARLQNTPNIVQIDPARVPKSTVRPRILMNTALAAMVGLLLAAGIVFLIEYLDDAIKTPEDVERLLQLPVLGFVAEMQHKSKGLEDVYVARQPRSPVAEGFRSLRTNIEFAAVQKPVRTLLVTSPGPAEGKTTVAVNLAAIIALSGKRVALVDADLRRPMVHKLLGLPNRDGLSSLFRSGERVHSVFRSKLELPNLLVVTSGSLPPNPAELLGSGRMEQILEELSALVEVVVIDTPPCLVADAQILSARVDAVLLVIQPGRTHAQPARACLELFRHAGARLIGTVLNRIPRSREYYYGGYQYYSAYSSRQESYAAAETADRTSSGADAGPGPAAPPPPAVPAYSMLRRLAGPPREAEELAPPEPPIK
jgi:polysaccharide biosynthesis transport protein